MKLYEEELLQIIIYLCQYLLISSPVNNNELYDQIEQYLTWVIQGKNDSEFINIGYELIKQCEEW